MNKRFSRVNLFINEKRKVEVLNAIPDAKLREHVLKEIGPFEVNPDDKMRIIKTHLMPSLLPSSVLQSQAKVGASLPHSFH